MFLMDDYSLAVAKELFAAFPQWQALARTEPADDGGSFLTLEVAPPKQANVEYPLMIQTENREITVGFDYSHAHFDQWADDGTDAGIDTAEHFVRQIIEEQIAVFSWWLDEQWRGSSYLEAGTAPKVPSWSTSNRIRVRSWRGTFNADINA
jgi:hypothetical protein